MSGACKMVLKLILHVGQASVIHSQAVYKHCFLVLAQQLKPAVQAACTSSRVIYSQTLTMRVQYSFPILGLTVWGVEPDATHQTSWLGNTILAATGRACALVAHQVALGSPDHVEQPGRARALPHHLIALLICAILGPASRHEMRLKGQHA